MLLLSTTLMVYPAHWRMVMKRTAQVLERCVACLLVLVAVSVAEAQEAKGVPKYRDLAANDGLECHMYTEMTSSLSGPSSGTLSSGGRSFECVDASGNSRAIKLTATQRLKNKKVAIITKSFGTIYYRNDETCVSSNTEKTEEGKPVQVCTDRDMYEMTDIQIKKLKAFLGL